jgi:site-specific DNA-cytosine methylase
MKILIACEYSGKVRDAFINAGHDAISCDLLEGEGQYHRDHYKGDAFNIINNPRNYESFKEIDMLIAFPPCTHLAVSGARYFEEKRKDGRQKQGIDFFMQLINANIPKICVENPVGIMSTHYRKPDQIIQPYNFGEDASKKTCLWLKGLPLLENTKYIEPTIINNKKIWANQTPSGQNKLGPSSDRAKIRSETYQGIASAMANQWG